MNIHPQFDQALSTCDTSGSAANYSSRCVTANLEDRHQGNNTLSTDELDTSGRLDSSFLATMDIFEEELMYSDSFLAPVPQENHHSNNIKAHQAPTKMAVRNTNFVRSLSNDFFLKQLIGEEGQAGNEVMPTAYDNTGCHKHPSPVVSSGAMPGLTYPSLDMQPQSMMRHQYQQPQQMQYYPPPPVVSQACGVVPNILPSQGGYPQAHLHQQPMGAMTSCPLVATTQQADNMKVGPRRTCSFPNCTNRIVQGGRCIGHGAKRKTCKHPGCDKRVKQAGMCSAHGPARKRCEHEGCTKVAVQGGKCIAHGARKRLCNVSECCKQGILGGFCKKHYDTVHGIVKVRAPRKKARTQSQYGACCA